MVNNGIAVIDKDANDWEIKNFPGWNADWTVNSVEFAPFSESNCDIHVDHSVLVIQRDTFANFFHDSGMAFI
jgi:hypothetical protein